MGAPAWNPERVRSLAEQGHELYGLWGRSMAWDQGPYPVLDGVVRPVDVAALPRTLAEHPPDVVYGLFQVYDEALWAPPSPGIEDGVWALLRGVLAARAAGAFDAPVTFHWGFDVHRLDLGVVQVLDAQVYCNREVLQWWTGDPADGGRGLDVLRGTPVVGFLDGDRPMAQFMGDDLSKPLSDRTREVHTACIGRPLGIDYVAAARAGIHLHVYGNAFDDVEQLLLRDVGVGALSRDIRLVRDFVHLHPTRQLIREPWAVVEREKAAWVREFSRYDAGWSYIGRPFDWPPLEDRAAIPNRLGTYVLAGLPVIASRLPGTFRYDELTRLGIALDLVGDDYVGLRERLDAERSTRAARQAALAARPGYSFEATITPLLELFEQARAAYFAGPDPARRRVPKEPATPLVRVSGGGTDGPPNGRGGATAAAFARRVAAFARRAPRRKVLERRLGSLRPDRARP